MTRQRTRTHKKNTHTHSRHTQHSSTTEKLTNRAPKIRTVGGYRSLVARVAPVLAALPILSQAAHFRWLCGQVVAIHHCMETDDAHTPRRMQPRCGSVTGAEELHSNKHPSAVVRTFPHMLGRPTTKTMTRRVPRCGRVHGDRGGDRWDRVRHCTKPCLARHVLLHMPLATRCLQIANHINRWW